MVRTQKQRPIKVSRDHETDKNDNARAKNEVIEKITDTDMDRSKSEDDSISEKSRGSEITEEKSDDIPYEIIKDPHSSIVQHHVDANQIRMLLICPNGEQRLYTFDTPVEECSVKDLIDEARIPIVDGLTIFKVKEAKHKLNYIIQYIFGTHSVPEENNPSNNNANDKAAAAGADISSGFHSSLGENNRSESEISEHEMAEEKDDLVESGESKSEPIGIRRKRKRRIVERSPAAKHLASIDTSSDGEDRRKRSLEKEDMERNNLELASLDDNENEAETIEILEREPAITNSCTLSGSTEMTIDYEKDIKGGGVPYDIRNMNQDSSIEIPFTFLICKTIMIGSHNYTPEERVIISQSGVEIRAPHLRDNTNLILLKLKFEDIVKVVVHFGENISAVFFYIKSSAGEIIRKSLGMEDPEGPYYKPLSRDDTQRLLTLVLGEITEESKLVLKTLFKPNKLLAELSSKETKSLLLAVSPKNIRVQIRKLLKIPEKTKSRKTLENTHTAKDEVNMPIKKDESSNQISEEIKSTFDFTLNEEPEETVFKRSGSLLKRPRQSTLRVNRSIDLESQCLLVYPPPPAKGGIAITARDFACLEDGHFLNDIIIDFYLKYLTVEVLAEEDRDRTHIFSIHFYKKLTTDITPVFNVDTPLALASKRFANIRKWTKNVNIFEKDFIIVPINENAHWFVAIICFPALVGKEQNNKTGGEATEVRYKTRKAEEMRLEAVTLKNGKKIKKLPCILLFDSLAGPKSQAQLVIKTLRKYLGFEYAAQVGEGVVFSETTIEGACPKVPQQNNFSDCGLYVLQYVESFFKDPITDFTFPIGSLEYWFDEAVVNRKREQISDLLKKLQKRS